MVAPLPSRCAPTPEPIPDVLDQGLMSVDAVAAFLAVSRRSVYRLPLPVVMVGRARRIPRRSVLAYAAERMRGGE